MAAMRRLARLTGQLLPGSSSASAGAASKAAGLSLFSSSTAANSKKVFKAWVVDSEKGKLKKRELSEFSNISELPQQDPAASVTVRVKYSDINYKDAMIIQGRHGVVRKFPIVPGIDMSGVVEQSDSPMWKPGDEVVLTGNKIGQHFDGGYSELCRVQAEWLVACPKSFSLEDCMVIGTAGFTAMQMVMELEEAGKVSPDKGPVLVTGAAGGVGSAAVAILSSRGYQVVASSGRGTELTEYFKKLGATEVIGRLEGDALKKPLQEQKWAGVVDCVGGPGLGVALAQTKFRGAVACVGVAAGGNLDSSIYPFVLRGVRLLGIDSTLPWNVAGLGDDQKQWEEDRLYRLEIWRRLEQDLSVEALRVMHEATVPLAETPAWCERLLAGNVRGRVVVQI